MPEETTSQPPVFTQPLKNLDLRENEPAHFECRLIPIGDPNLRVEWFRNGVPMPQGQFTVSTHHLTRNNTDAICNVHTARQLFAAEIVKIFEPQTEDFLLKKEKKSQYRFPVSLNAGSKVKTTHDFGFVALDLNYVYPEDSGTYTCKATNHLGTASTSAALVVRCKHFFCGTRVYSIMLPSSLSCDRICHLNIRFQ